MSVPKPKKMVSRSVAIALGIISIILIAGLAGAFAYYVSAHNHSDSEYDALQSQVNDLTDEVNGDKYVVLTNQTINLGSNYTSWHFLVNETGHISIIVNSLSPSYYWAYVRVIWSVPVHTGYTISYDDNVTYGQYIGIPTNLRFPVLVLHQPYSYPYNNDYTDVEVRVGGINLPNGYSETVTITNYY